MSRPTLLVAALLTASTVGAGAVSAAASSNPMFCRGLRRFNHSISSTGTVTVEAAFTRGAGPAGDMGQNLSPGSCAWLDRGVSAQEKDWLRLLPGLISAGEYSVNYTMDEQGRTSVGVSSDASKAMQQLVLVQAFDGGTALIVERMLKLMPQFECKGAALGFPFTATPTECATKCIQTTGCRGFNWTVITDAKGTCTHLSSAPQCVPAKPGYWGGSR